MYFVSKVIHATAVAIVGTGVETQNIQYPAVEIEDSQL